MAVRSSDYVRRPGRYQEAADLTGRLLEEEYFGVCTVKKNKTAAIELFRQLSGGKSFDEANGHLPFERAVTFAKNFQPGDDPTCPSTKVARDLLDFVAEEIGVDPEGDDALELKFYTAVGSPLDKYHKTDAFVEYKGQRVLLDVTRNPNKQFDDSSDNRIIMQELPDYGIKEERAQYATELRKYARAVAQIFEPAEHTREIEERRVAMR
ncbi:MAG: hypothetical protein V1902_02540 [Candidatus Falkowbacteria bacterium]